MTAGRNRAGYLSGPPGAAFKETGERGSPEPRPIGRGAAGRRSFRQHCRTRSGNFPARRPPTCGSRPAPIHRSPAVPAGGIRPARPPHAPAPRRGSRGEEPADSLAAFAYWDGRRG